MAITINASDAAMPSTFHPSLQPGNVQAVAPRHGQADDGQKSQNQEPAK
ncbi:MAG: hypothetical protein HHJ16_02445 [Polaromonas sp.]|nr:hypothetical protein [Polaromonas sp.]